MCWAHHDSCDHSMAFACSWYLRSGVGQLVQFSFELGIGTNFTQWRNLAKENVLGFAVHIKAQETPRFQSAAYVLLQKECGAWLWSICEACDLNFDYDIYDYQSAHSWARFVTTHSTKEPAATVRFQGVLEESFKMSKKHFSSTPLFIEIIENYSLNMSKNIDITNLDFWMSCPPEKMLHLLLMETMSRQTQKPPMIQMAPHVSSVASWLTRMLFVQFSCKWQIARHCGIAPAG